MKNKGLIATIIILLGVIIVLLVTLLLVKMPSVISFDGFGLIKETEVIDESIEVKKETETQPYVEIVEVPKLNTNIHTYEGYNGNVSIEYPEITGMEDTVLQENINNKLRTNALSIVPLYPISTALQDLSIFCEVNYLDENYITVVYSGQVVGKQSTSENANSRTGASYKSKNVTNTSNKDPYLNGFVDPLAGVQSVVNQSAFTNISEFSALPLPKVGGTTVGKESSGKTSNKGASNEINGSKSSENEHTADKGPTVYEEPAPSANREIGPAAQGRDAVTGPGVSGSIQQGAPISGFASSSASTINQKIFYSNTIDLKKGIDVKLSDVADPQVLAKYARSSNVEFVNIDENMKNEVRTYIRKTVESTLASQLANETDFRNKDLKAWPKHFSFVGSDGNIYFTIKLSSKLGNYAIIKYQK